MNPPISYPFEAAPATGTFMPVADGIYWLRMPLPISLNHINLWLIEGKNGFTIVDTGWASEENIAVWEHVEQTLLQGKPVEKVVVTHMHPDHIGLAGWLCGTYKADLYMSRSEYLTCQLLLGYTHEEAPKDALDFYQALGYNERQLHNYRAHFGNFGQFVRCLPHSFHRLQEGGSVRMGDSDWQVVIGEGHSPEHVCLYSPERKILISGDQLLPTISSNVSVWPTEPEANPLEDWLRSCHRLAKLIPDDTLILPSHGKVFYGAATRLHAQIEEIEENLEKLAELCTEPRRANDTFTTLFRSTITNSNLGMAIGESLAHLHCLRARGRMEVEFREGVGYWKTIG